MTENERVKELRKSLGLTMEKFGARVGVTKVAISNIEKGNRGVTDQMRRSICREFGVNEAWLTDGAGEMRVTTYGDEVAALAARYGLDEADQAVIAEFARLSPEERAAVKRYILEVSRALDAAPDGSTLADADIEAEVTDYRRQLTEEKKAGGGSQVLPVQDASDTTRESA